MTEPAVPGWSQLGDLPGLAGSYDPQRFTGRAPVNPYVIGFFTALAYVLAWLAGVTASVSGRLLLLGVIVVAALGLSRAFGSDADGELSGLPAGTVLGPDSAADPPILVDQGQSRAR